MNLVLLLQESEVKAMPLSPLDKGWGPTAGPVLHAAASSLQEFGF